MLQEDILENNDEWNTASNITFESFYNNLVLDDKDWFVIYLEENMNMSLYLILDKGTNSVNVTFFRDDLVSTTGLISKGTESIQILITDVDITGNYYLELENTTVTSDHNYSIYCTYLKEDLYENNNEINNASRMYEGVYNLHCLNEEWFMFFGQPNWTLSSNLYFYDYATLDFEIISVDQMTVLNASIITPSYSTGWVLRKIYYNFSIGGSTGWYFLHITPTSGISPYQFELYINGNPLEAPILATPIFNGAPRWDVTLQWNSIYGAYNYRIFRDINNITSVEGMTPIHTTTLKAYNDTPSENGTYYYVVMASFFSFNSSISNCVNITVVVPSIRVPQLSEITPLTDHDGIIQVSWNYIAQASIYYVFRNNSIIISLEDLQPYQTTSMNSISDQVYENETYFYVVIAGNTTLNSTISNCVYVHVNLTCPNASVINSLTPNPSYDGIFQVSWNFQYDVTTYYLFREATEITDPSSLTAYQILTGSQTSYSETISVNNTYYYRLIGENFNGNSTLSNEVSINVMIPTIISPRLDYFYPNPDHDGIVTIRWNSVLKASCYLVFRNASEFNTTDGLQLIANISAIQYQDTLGTNGQYFYAIMASNVTHNSSLSNCESINISISVPNQPLIKTISPNPSTNGLINIQWDYQNEVIRFYLFRKESEIVNANGLEPLAICNANQPSFYDHIETNGQYYYAVIAENQIGNSSLSANMTLNVTIPPIVAPNLYNIYPSTDHDGYIRLRWNSVEHATKYFVFRDVVPIDTIGARSPLNSTNYTTYMDTIDTENTYYYAIIAGNDTVNSSLSNYRNVIVFFDEPNSPTLSMQEFGTDDDGFVHLSWPFQFDVEKYWIFRHTEYFTSVLDLPPIIILDADTLGYNDYNPQNGVFWYRIMASNRIGNSSLSSEFNITIQLKSFPNYSMYYGSDFRWVNISSSPDLALGLNQYVQSNLPFQFPFYGSSFSKIYISANGYVSFTDSSPTQALSPVFPSSEPDTNYTIAAFWSYLRSQTAGGSGTIKLYNGSNFWLVRWENIQNYVGTLMGSFEIVLYYDGTIKIQFDYLGNIGGYTCGINYGNGFHGISFTHLNSTLDNFTLLIANTQYYSLPHINFLSPSVYEKSSPAMQLQWRIIDDEFLDPFFEIWRNNSHLLSGKWINGTILNTSLYSEEFMDYEYRIKVWDGKRGFLEYITIVQVKNFAAKIISPQHLVLNSTDIPYDLTFQILDYSTNSTKYSVYINGSLVQNGTWSHGINITVKFANNTTGTYLISIFVNDGYDLISISNCTVVILPETEASDSDGNNYGYIIVGASTMIIITLIIIVKKKLRLKIQNELKSGN